MGLSTKPYIGSRDFFPQETAFRNWLFGIQRNICLTYGYQEYGAPILEPLSLYQAKSSEEIVSEQLYRFTDRGDREVAIRPEMTPTLARMVASRAQELPRPIRWFSIANFMRYERPGRGRLREFYQLNVDLLGSSSPAADAEILSMAVDLLRAYGAPDDAFTVRFSDRRLLDSYLRLEDPEGMRQVGRLLDKREKITEEEFDTQLSQLCPDEECRKRVKRFLELTTADLEEMAAKGEMDREAVDQLLAVERLVEHVNARTAVVFDPGIVRGFDYYTGLIFEIYDNHPDNRRALFGGGRYDRLLGLFGKEEIPAVGFGMGDVTLQNFIELHNLHPRDLHEPRGVFLTLFSPDLMEENFRLARLLRGEGVPVEMALEASSRLGKQFQIAEKKGARYVLIQGEDEVKQGVVRIKDLVTGEQSDLTREALLERLKQTTPPTGEES